MNTTNTTDITTNETTVKCPVLWQTSSSMNKRLHGTSILLVEDSEIEQMLYSRMLNDSGAEIDVGEDGLEGLNLALVGDYDVVLLDIEMPRMNGLKVAQALRRKFYSVPLIAMTSYSQSKDLENLVNLGFTDLLTKPVRKSKLLETIEKYKYIT